MTAAWFAQHSGFGTRSSLSTVASGSRCGLLSTRRSCASNIRIGATIFHTITFVQPGSDKQINQVEPAQINPTVFD